MIILGGGTGTPITTTGGVTTLGVWCDIYSLAALQEDMPTTLSAASLRRYLDSALEMVFGYIGHSFGQALWIYNSGDGGATSATVSVSAGGVLTLTVVGGTNAGVETFTLSAYTLWGLATAIDSLAKGWQVKVVSDPEQPASNLRVVASLSVLGYENQRPLCLCSWTEIHSGNGETHLFLKWPFRSVLEVTEDDTDLTEETDFWARREGWLLRASGAGVCVSSNFSGWSDNAPNNITVRYIPWWIGPVPTVVARVVMGLIQLLTTETGYHSEKIGDYSYTKNGNTILTWLQMLDGLGNGFATFASGVGGGLW